MTYYSSGVIFGRRMTYIITAEWSLQSDYPTGHRRSTILLSQTIGRRHFPSAAPSSEHSISSPPPQDLFYFHRPFCLFRLQSRLTLLGRSFTRRRCEPTTTRTLFFSNFERRPFQSPGRLNCDTCWRPFAPHGARGPPAVDQCFPRRDVDRRTVAICCCSDRH